MNTTTKTEAVRKSPISGRTVNSLELHIELCAACSRGLPCPIGSKIVRDARAAARGVR